MPDLNSNPSDGEIAQATATLRDAYERTIDLLGDVACGLSVHEAMVMAYCRGAETERRDREARHGERQVATPVIPMVTVKVDSARSFHRLATFAQEVATYSLHHPAEKELWALLRRLRDDLAAIEAEASV